MRRRRLLAALAAAGSAPLAGCPGDSTGASSPSSPVATGRPSATAPSDRPVGYTHVQPTGNRVLRASGDVASTDPVEYVLEERPVWIAAVPGTEDATSVWGVVTASGDAGSFTVRDGAVVDDRRLGSFPRETPLALTGSSDGPGIVPHPGSGSKLSNPVPAGEGRLFVTRHGAVIYRAGSIRERTDVGALPDARLVRLAPGRFALLGGRTERYGHGALGDDLEASTVVVASVGEAASGSDPLTVATPVEIDAPAVVEGIAPMAADLTGDGARDLVVTVADSERGARLVAFDADGTRLATGPGFGSGFRWRHQLCVAPLGPGGERELAAVQTPHIGGTARFHRRSGDRLEVVASVEGVSSHALGSRNLDGGLAADLDADGAWELLVPTDARDALVAIRRTERGARTVWRRALAGTLATNVTGTRIPGGGLAVGAGGSDGTVRVWQG